MLYSAVIPVLNDKPTPDLSDNNDDNELPPLALIRELVPSLIPSSFPKAVEDAFNSSCVDDDDALQLAVPTLQLH
jgi:hypothetical protein